jgi:HEAT repeat protein
MKAIAVPVLLLPVIFVAGLLVMPASAVAQQQPRAAAAAAGDEATLVRQGWALLAKGDAAGAAEKAADAVKQSPRDLAALALMIEAGVSRGGSTTALDDYERWLGQRKLEEPAALRRIARTVLEEAAVSSDVTAAFEARRALAGDGDRRARADLLHRMKEGGRADVRALAALGDPDAVTTLLKELESPGSPLGTIQALGESRQSAAVQPLAAKLKDPRSEVRGAVAEALGLIGTAEAHALLKPLLEDQSMHVRVKAAAALRRLNDPSGELVFKELLAAAGTSSRSRLVAAEAMAGRPDSAWKALVTGLLEADEPDVRLAAAGLIAPHDPDAAQRALTALADHQNPSVREEASRQAAAFSHDFTALRALFRSADPLTRVAAASKILALTR